jgi:predicted small lipoprotein YifL
MKKVLLLGLVMVMVLAAFAGCGNNNASESPSPTATAAAEETPAATETAQAEEPAATGTVMTGLGNVISIAKSKSVATDDEGNPVDALAQIDTTMVAVTLDSEGKILNVKIDMVQPKVNFDAEGQLVTDTSQPIQTKVELGDAYGMEKASSIGKEWYEQIAALEDWMVGKTIDEVMGIQLNEESVPTEADLTSSVTVSVEGYLAAVKEAVDNAKNFGVEAKGATRTGLGSITSIKKSASATAEADALGQADVIMVAVTVDEDNKIVGVLIDNGQVKVNFDTAGTLLTDPTEKPMTKVELGDEYGMKKASSIGKEWYEQIQALGQWMIGKTIDEVKAMKTYEKDEAHPAVPEEADLTSSVTISVENYIAAVEKAIANAD